jgi:hypothetical protein
VAGATLALYSVGRDARGNFIAPVVASWIVNGGIGTVVPSAGSSSVLRAERSGTGAVELVHPLLPGDRTGTLQVVPAAAARLEIEDAGGNVLDARTLTADDSLQAFAVLRDAFGNRAGVAAATWAIEGDSAAALLRDGGPSESSWLAARHPGSVRIVARWDSLAAASGMLAIVPGRLARTAIETAAGGAGSPVGTTALAAGGSLDLYCIGRDMDGNFVAAMEADWTVAGGIGRLDASTGSSTRFRAERLGTGHVRALVPSAPEARTGDLVVSAGPAARLAIESTLGDPEMPLADATFTADDSLQAFAVLRDAYGNRVAPAPALWAIAGDSASVRLGASGPIEAVWLEALHPGTVHLAARWDSLAATSGALVIVPGRLAGITIETAPGGAGVPVGDMTLPAGSRLDLHAVGRDADGNPVGATSVNWSAAGDAGRVDPAAGERTTFHAERPGSTRARALHPLVPAATTGTLAVVAGTPARLLIERTPGDPLDPLGQLALTPDDSLAAYAVARDSIGNWVADVAATWSLAGDAEAGMLRSAGPAIDTWFLPRHPGNAQLVAAWNGLEAASGTLAVRPGGPAGAIPIAATSDTLRIGTRAGLALGPVRDRHGNAVADGTLLDLSTDTGTVSGADADPAAPGLQLALLGGTATADFTAPAGAGAARLVAAAGAGRGTLDLAILPPADMEIVAGSLSPAEVLRGSAFGARIRVRSRDSRPLRLAGGELRFADGNGNVFAASLAGPFTLAPGAEADLAFQEALLPEGLQPGTYAPRAALAGADDLGESFTLQRTLPPASLRVWSGANVRCVARTPSHLTRGESVRFALQLLNAGDVPAALDAAGCTLGDSVSGFVTSVDAASDLVLAPGTVTAVDFLPATWPATSSAGPSPLVLDLAGTQPGGAFAQSLPVPAVQVHAPAWLEPVPGSLAPAVAPAGARPEVRVALRNAGESELVLDATTRIRLGDRDAALAETVRVLPDSARELRFAALDLAGLLPGRHAVEIAARGTQYGALFAQDLLLPDSLVVFAPAALTILEVRPSQTAATGGQTRPWEIAVVVLNAGQSRYRIDDARVRIVLGGLDRTASYVLERRKPLDFPLAPATADTLHFRVLRTGPDLGLATLEAHLRATDLGTGMPIEADTFEGGKGSLLVQAPGDPRAGRLVLDASTATSGQTRTITARLEIRNAGEAVVELDTTQLASILDMQPPVPRRAYRAQPAPRLPSGETLALTWDLGPFDLPPGPIVIQAAPRCIESNSGSILEVAVAPETLLVQSPAALLLDAAAAPASVTRRQIRPWAVRLGLRNDGESAVRLQSPELRFQSMGADASAGFSVAVPARLEGAPDRRLAGRSRGELLFTVNATDSLARTVFILLAGTAREIDSGREFALPATTGLAVRVEREPQVVVLDSTLVPRAASCGQRIDVRLAVRNAGEAAVELDPERSAARLGDATASLRGAVHLAGDGQVRLDFAPLLVDVGAGFHALQLHLEGTENGNPWSADLGTAPILRVDAAASLEILAVRAGQELVTRGQMRPWTVEVALANRGAAAALESASLSFGLGASDVSASFTVRAPVAFASGSTTIASGAADTLRFEVLRTAEVEGVVVLDATLNARDTNSGAALTARSLGSARGSVRIAAQARPILTAALPSQPRVSAGQTGAWHVVLRVRNDGGSPWTPDWSSAALRIGTAADDSALSPAGFAGGPETLGAGATGEARFQVLRTGAETGSLAIVLALAGTQSTDGSRWEAASHVPAAILAQAPARAVLDSLAASVTRPGRVNAGQEVPVAVAIRNAGQADLARCSVRLRATNAAPAETLLAARIAGGERLELAGRFRAGGPGAVLVEGEVVEAVDANDSTRADCWGAPRTARTQLLAETPGSLRIAVAPSQPRVSAGQTTRWWIAVEVRNEGNEPLLLRAPRADDLQFRRGDAVQSDYLLSPPAEMQEGGLELPGGGHGTLRYGVLRTGDAGGQVNVRATLAATHRNAPSAAPAAASAEASFDVDNEPGVRVLATETVTWRRARGHDDFRVNVGQSFDVRVTVENTGGTWLDSIVVQVESQAGNSSTAGPARLGSLAPGQRAAIDLPVVAGTWTSEPGLPESFTAHVVAARDRNTGLAVLPGAAVDNATFAYVETPAELAFSAWIDAPEGARDGVLSAGQEFVLAARADNLGGAALRTAGRLELAAPSGFDLAAGEPAATFVAGTTVRWTLRAPAAPCIDSLAVRIAVLPPDENDGQPARLRTDRDVLPLVVRTTGELLGSLTIHAPEGARDGTVSTGQEVECELHLRGDPELVERQAELVLPPGWRLAASETPKHDLPAEPETWTSWSLVAGGTPGRASIALQVRAVDRNDATPRTTADSLQVTIQRAPRLALAARIVAPEEACDARLVPGQSFRVRTWVRNHGEAAAVGPGTLRLQGLPEGWIAATSSQSFTLDAAGAASVDWELAAPPDWRPGAATLVFGFGPLPADANSGAGALAHPDSASASIVVVLGGDAVLVDATAAPARLAAAGERALPLLAVRLTNQAENAVQIEALGVLPLVDGAPASAAVFEGLSLVRAGAVAETLAVAPPGAGVAWISTSGHAAGRLAAGATAVFHLSCDVAPGAPARGLSVALQDRDGKVLVQAVEAGSRTPLPVRASGAMLESAPLRVVAASLQAWNAPNPFHFGRETTTIRYRLAASADVLVRIHTLQGALVWQARRHETTEGPALRELAWDGRNGAGEPVRNGVYVCQVTAGDESTRFKIAVVR